MNYKKDIENLLDLDGMIIEQAGGYWTKFEARLIPKSTEEIPHGVRYSLTLHDKNGQRVMGFDNTHAVKNNINCKGRKTYDHRHRHSNDEGIPYKFVDAHQLIEDFWIEVDKLLKTLGIEE